MGTFKYRRKFMYTAVCVFTLVTIRNILLPGNNLHVRSRYHGIRIKDLSKNVTRETHSVGSLTRLMAEKLDHKPRNSIDNTNLDSYVINILSSNSSKKTTFLQNETQLSFISASNLTQIKDKIDDTRKDISKHNVSARSHALKTENSTKQGDANKYNLIKEAENSDEEEEDEEEDRNNKFDITDLDDHITFPKQQQQQQQQQQHQNQHSQLSERNRLKWNGDYDIKLKNTLEYRKQVYEAHVRPIQNNLGIDCNALIDKDCKNEVEKAKQRMQQAPRRGISTDKYAKTGNCENFRGGRGYIDHPLSQMELDFPLAFEITAYRDVEQTERLLRAIYRPHNFYCFHLDSKMSQLDRSAFERIAQCLDNVFITEKSINVTWGEFSVLEAELLCMEKLWQYKKWKYYINLTGQEFPLKTNREIVAILNSLEGANIVDGTWIRARHKYFYRWTIAGIPPPHHIRPIKGSVHVALNRYFVDFALHDQRSRDFLDWLKKTQIPDETFFSSLNHNPHLGINGSFLGEAEEYPLKPSLMRYKNWEMGHSVFVRGCAGKYVRHICVLGVGDLNKAYNDIGLFVNKFNIDFEYLALDCLEEILYKKTWDQYINDVNIDTTYFKHLDYVKRKLYVSPQV